MSGSLDNRREEQIEEVIQGYKDVGKKVAEQRNLLEARHTALQTRKDSVVAHIEETFSHLHDILNDKKSALLSELSEFVKRDDERLKAALKESDTASKCLETEISVAELLKAGNATFESVSLSDFTRTLEAMRESVAKRQQEIVKELTCPEFCPDTTVIEDLRDAHVGRFLENEGKVFVNDDETQGESHGSVMSVAAPSITSEDGPTEERSADLEGISSRFRDNGTLVAHNSPYMYIDRLSLSHLESRENESETDSIRHQYYPSPTSNHHSPAVEHDRSLATESPRKVHELVKDHCFPTKTKFERGLASVDGVAVTRSHVCTVDKINQKIKFFTYTGYLESSIASPNSEVYGVTSLGESADSRFVITVPQLRCLYFIAVSADEEKAVAKKVQLRVGYTAIGRGATEGTLVAACARLPFGGFPIRVQLIKFDGTLLKTFTKTPSGADFVYPRCVAMFQDEIIVADLKLGVVVAMRENGEGVGQYSGTAAHALKEPMDMTCDQDGNIFVMDGVDTGVIHLIDKHCRPLEMIFLVDLKYTPRFISFDVQEKRLAAASQSGEVYIFGFKQRCKQATSPAVNEYPPASTDGGGRHDDTESEAHAGHLGYDSLPHRSQAMSSEGDIADLSSSRPRAPLIPEGVHSHVSSVKEGTDDKKLTSTC